MRRGKIIGAIVLAIAIGLILAQQLGDPNAVPEESAPPQRPAASQSPEPAVAPAATGLLPAPGETRSFTVDAAQSEVYWRIYRAGALARLGHNHVISAGDMQGRVTLTDDLEAAQWSLSFPVADLVIDDPEIRARYGEDFESVPSEEDKAGTKTNMLTEALLDGAAHPEIRLQGTGVYGSLAAAELPVTIEIVGRSIAKRLPAAIEIDEDSLSVSGEFRLSHADLGLTPFSLFNGAMAVADEIDFSYRILAIADSP